MIKYCKRTLTWGLLTICVLLIGGVTYYSLRYSMQVIDLAVNQPALWETKDSLPLHLLCGMVFFAVIAGADILLKKCKNAEKWLNGLLYVVMGATLAAGLIWVLNGNFYAQNDSRSVLDCIGRIRNGDFSDLMPNGYLGAFQNQLGIAAIFQFVFFLFGTEKDIVLQVINALCIPCVIFAGNRFLKEINVPQAGHICYLTSMLFCFPLLVYTPFVYGEIISVTAGCFFIWAAVCYLKRGGAATWMALLISAVIGTLAKGNFPVLLIAFGIMAALYSIRRKNALPLLCAVTVILAAVSGNKACRAYYEHISGIKLDQGIPIEGWIAMGLNDIMPVPGMYNGYNMEIYAKHDYVREAAKAESLAYIHDRLAMLVNNVGVGWKPFWKTKLLAQWNDPTLTCFMENRAFIPEPKIPAIKEIMIDIGKYYPVAIECMNQYQFLLYLGMLFYCVAAFRRKEAFYELLPLVILFGGFLFTVIWETMARYVFPYIIYMVPLSAMGWGYAQEWLQKLWRWMGRAGVMDAGKKKDMPDSGV